MHDKVLKFGMCCRQSVSDEQAVSADDLLSTTISAIVVAQPQHLTSCLEYLKLFHGTGDWSGMTGFQVATLEAAAAYIEQLHPSFSAHSVPGDLQSCKLPLHSYARSDPNCCWSDRPLLSSLLVPGHLLFCKLPIWINTGSDRACSCLCSCIHCWGGQRKAHMNDLAAYKMETSTISTTEGMMHTEEGPRHSQEFVLALLEHDEPLTFANSMLAQPGSSPVQIPSRHKGQSPDNLRCAGTLDCFMRYHTQPFPCTSYILMPLRCRAVSPVSL